MKRERRAARPGYAATVEAQGLSFHARDGYWTEDACYRFSLAEIEVVEAATAELHAMCMQALRTVVEAGRLGELKIPESFWQPIATSLRRNDFSLYGRFDLAYDGRSAPKLLEYNADTPTSLLESAVCQWFWMRDCFPKADQFNSLHERLIARWKALPGSGAVHLASLAGDEEDFACIAYLMDTVTQAGRLAKRLDIEALGWDPKARAFVDVEGEAIEYLFKLYPWEWLMREEFGAHIADGTTQFIEPPWKSVLSCKGLLPILWELFPGHPNLLPAYFEPGKLTDYARKPLYSREGSNIALYAGDACLKEALGPYGEEGCIYQQLHVLPAFDGRFPVIGSWLVDGEPAGMCIREDASPITTNSSHFIPHYFVE
jgi:glutathionylspermidine synthase